MPGRSLFFGCVALVAQAGFYRMSIMGVVHAVPKFDQPDLRPKSGALGSELGDLRFRVWPRRRFSRSRCAPPDGVGTSNIAAVGRLRAGEWNVAQIGAESAFDRAPMPADGTSGGTWMTPQVDTLSRATGPRFSGRPLDAPNDRHVIERAGPQTQPSHACVRGHCALCCNRSAFILVPSRCRLARVPLARRPSVPPPAHV